MNLKIWLSTIIRNKNVGALVLLISISSLLNAQNNDFQTWHSLSLKKKLEVFHFSGEVNYRTQDNVHQTKQLFYNLGIGAEVFKNFELSSIVRYYQINNSKHFNFIRYDFDANYRFKKVRKIKPEIRVKYQTSYGNIKGFNDETLRLKIELSRKIKPLASEVSISSEAFWETKFQESNNGLRSGIKAQTKINKHLKVGLFYTIDLEMNSNINDHLYILGTDIKISY